MVGGGASVEFGAAGHGETDVVEDIRSGAKRCPVFPACSTIQSICPFLETATQLPSVPHSALRAQEADGAVAGRCVAVAECVDPKAGCRYAAP